MGTTSPTTTAQAAKIPTINFIVASSVRRQSWRLTFAQYRENGGHPQLHDLYLARLFARQMAQTLPLPTAKERCAIQFLNSANSKLVQWYGWLGKFDLPRA